MTSLVAARLVNLALYQAGWFACVLGGARGRPWLGAAAGLALVLVHLALVERRAEEATFAALAALAGTAIDSAQQAAGTVALPSGHYAAWLCPAWLTVLWAQFATLPCHSLAWLAGRPVACALLGAAGGAARVLRRGAARRGDLPLRADRRLRRHGAGVGRRISPAHAFRGALRGLPGALPLAANREGPRRGPRLEVGS